MDEFSSAHGAALPPPHPAHCPPWCTDCDHSDLGPPGATLHRSPPATVAVYDEGCDLVDAYVRAAFWDKTPDWIGTDPADLERPHVEVHVPGGDVQLYLNPGQARAFAAALVRAADAADTEGFYRPPVTPGAPLGRHARHYAVAPGLMPRHRSAWMDRGMPDRRASTMIIRRYRNGTVHARHSHNRSG